MEKDLIQLAAHAKTDPCASALEREEDESLLPHRLERIYDLVEAKKEDLFVFTSSGAEAINQVLLSVFLQVSRTTGKCHFITSQVEDAPTLQMMKQLEELGCFVKIAPINEKGEIDVAKLSELINPRTALISITMAQGLTGVIQPVEEIAKIAQQKGVLLHLDGTYALGKYYFSFREINADYLTFSGDKIHSTIGTGGLFAKKGAPLVPLILGGNGLRGGTLDTPAVLSLCAAAAQASLFLDAMSVEVAFLRDKWEREICKQIPDSQVLFRDSLRLPNTTTIAFGNVHQEALQYLLKRAKVETLIGGNYCQHLYHILQASKVDPSIANTSLSFSLSRMTTEEELQRSVAKISQAVSLLRTISQGRSAKGTDTSTYLSHPISSKKLREKIDRLRFAGSFTEAEAKEKGMKLVIGEEGSLAFHWLVDESDGIIADAKFQAFGPISLLAAAEIACELVIRKNYQQASRISADLIDQHVRDKKETPAFSKEAHSHLNQVIAAIDSATQQCNGIPCPSSDYDVTPIAWEAGENPDGIPGWEQFSNDKKLYLIEEVIDKEIRPYVELDAGGVQVVELRENNELLISYQGSCTTCHSATGSTLTAIQQILRARIYPKLTIIPQL